MNFIRIILFLALFVPFMSALSGCGSDAFLDALKEESDFIAPFDIVVSNDKSLRIFNYKTPDTGSNYSIKSGDDASYLNIPESLSLTVTDNVNGTDDIVVDNVTGLTWTKCTATSENTMDTADDCSGSTATSYMGWQNAVSTCENLTYAGFSDWRLPRLPELLSILNYDSVVSSPAAVDVSKFPKTRAAVNEGYWTYTSKLFIDDFGNTADWGWIVFFNIYHPESRIIPVWGNVELPNITDFRIKVGYDKTTSAYIAEKQFVRCVRGGNN